MTVTRKLLISRSWVQAVVIVFLFGFLVLGILAWQTYTGEPPIPVRTTSPNGQLVFSRDDVMEGQGIFLRNGLMEYGSIFGHGAYLGPDYTADYLHRAALSVLDQYGGSSSSRARLAAIDDFKTNRYNDATGVLIYSDPQVRAFGELKNYGSEQEFG